ncbi:S8 family serine peptidase [Rhizobium anhuiense]|nr:S8 family serine peptidase [Rhizobium leguminosarum bv. viciae]NKM58460.1 S8 family serine peptidase [Rhizobium anhuiense]
MVTKSLNASGLTLLKVEKQVGAPAEATVFATEKGLQKLRKKIEDFGGDPPVNEDGSFKPPKNADLVQSISAISEAGLRALWRSPGGRFPTEPGKKAWEVWLGKADAPDFFAGAAEYGVAIGTDRLEFPEDLVVIAVATAVELAAAVRNLGGVRALATPTRTADDFDAMPIEEQHQWVDDLVDRTTFAFNVDPNYITLLDRGVSRAHPLIQPALAAADRHAAELAWDVNDTVGHGTQLAGLALFGDLSTVLQTTLPITIGHRLESAKIIPDAGHNPHHLLGTATRKGINAAEASAARRRTFCLASTTEDDTPHDGAPTSWSSEIDQLASGASGLQKRQRLVLVSAGNSDQNAFTGGNYLAISDQPDNELESPAQAWNAISVGAYTQKVTMPPGEPGVCIAPLGDLAPSSRTASWQSYWPIKPDVVYEGGNWFLHGAPPPMKHPALAPLTTDHQYPLRAFTTCGETSAATALASRDITALWSDYPELWPETVRAIFVSSARWTNQMLGHVPLQPSKTDLGILFRRYGYGVPDMERARRSASNALTLIVEDTIQPYKKSATKNAEHIHNELKLFELPWPVKELRRLGAAEVKLRISLSTFMSPNPSEPARGNKYRYASHNLRFKLNRPNEKAGAFIKRISKIAEETDEGAIEEPDGWMFGPNRRDVGSLQIDQLTCAASDLARRNLIAVHPVTGWWKAKSIPDPHNLNARFALVVEIDAGTVPAELYAEVQAAIANMAAAVVAV